MKKEKIVGDKLFKYESGGNEKHGKFMHIFSNCHVIFSQTETILSPDRPKYTDTYYSCGFWEKESVTKVSKND